MTRAVRAATLVIMVAAVGVVAGCGADDHTSVRAGPAAPRTAVASSTAPPDDPSSTAVVRTPRGLTTEQRRVDRRDADQVATAFAVRLEAWDTALDRRPNDAVRRVVTYATPQLRSRMTAGTPIAAPGRRWNDLAAHAGWVSVTTRLGGLGPAPTSPRHAVRAVTVTPIDHGVDGWTAFPDSGRTYVITLERSRATAAWTVSGYTIQ